MSSTASLAGKTAIVTGASSGIGRAIAEHLGAAGAHVYLAGRTRADMEAAQREIQSSGGTATIVTVDVRQPGAVAALVEGALRDTGRVDIMVNNAGVSYPTPIIEADPEHWRVMFETNVLALLAGCQAAVRAMRKCGADGHIVNISSIAAQRSDSGVYGATKHAVNCISSTLRKELEEDSIRVTNIMPGAVVTNFARNFDPAVVAGFVAMAGLTVDVPTSGRLPDAVFEEMQPKMKQLFASADDVAAAVMFAVTQPISVNIADMVVRPPKQLAL